MNHNLQQTNVRLRAKILVLKAQVNRLQTKLNQYEEKIQVTPHVSKLFQFLLYFR